MRRLWSSCIACRPQLPIRSLRATRAVEALYRDYGSTSRSSAIHADSRPLKQERPKAKAGRKVFVNDNVDEYVLTAKLKKILSAPQGSADDSKTRDERLRRAMDLVKDVKPHRYNHTSIWNPLLVELIQLGRVKEAQSYFRDLIKRGGSVDAWTKTSMFNALANHVTELDLAALNKDNLEARKQLISNFGQEINRRELKSSVTPSEELLIANTLLKLLARLGDVEAAGETISDLNQSNRPDIWTYQNYFRAIRTFLSSSDSGNTESADLAERHIRKAWSSLNQSGITQDAKIVSTFLSAWTSLHRLRPTPENQDKALRAIKECARTAYGLDLSTVRNRDMTERKEIARVPSVQVTPSTIEDLYVKLVTIHAYDTIMKLTERLYEHAIYRTGLKELLTARSLELIVLACKAAKDKLLSKRISQLTKELRLSPAKAPQTRALPIIEPRHHPSNRKELNPQLQKSPLTRPLVQSRLFSTSAAGGDSPTSLARAMAPHCKIAGVMRKTVAIYFERGPGRSLLLRRYSHRLLGISLFKLPPSDRDLKSDSMKFCVVISTKTAKLAVVRNRIRRRVREAIRFLWKEGLVSPSLQHNYLCFPSLECYSLEWKQLLKLLLDGIRYLHGSESSRTAAS